MVFVDAGIDPLLARKSTDQGRALEARKEEPATLGRALATFMAFLVDEWVKAAMELLITAPSASGSPDVVVLATPTAVSI